jgi:hypothetical protein
MNEPGDALVRLQAKGIEHTAIVGVPARDPEFSRAGQRG